MIRALLLWGVYAASPELRAGAAQRGAGPAELEGQPPGPAAGFSAGAPAVAPEAPKPGRGKSRAVTAARLHDMLKERLDRPRRMQAAWLEEKSKFPPGPSLLLLPLAPAFAMVMGGGLIRKQPFKEQAVDEKQRLRLGKEQNDVSLTMPFFDNLVETIEDCMGMLSRVEGIESTIPGLILHVGPQIDQTWSAASDRAVNTINRGRQTSENFFNKLNRKWTLLYRAILEIHGYIEQKMEYIDRTWKQATTLFEALDKKSRKWCAREYRAVFREMKKALSKAKKRVVLVAKFGHG